MHFDEKPKPFAENQSSSPSHHHQSTRENTKGKWWTEISVEPNTSFSNSKHKLFASKNRQYYDDKKLQKT